MKPNPYALGIPIVREELHGDLAVYLKELEEEESRRRTERPIGRVPEMVVYLLGAA